MCGWWDVGCRVEEGIAGAIKDGLEGIAASTLQGVGHVMGEIATMWVRIDTPVLVNGAGDPTHSPGDHAPAAASFVTVLGWVQTIAFGIMVLCLIAAAVKLANSERHAAHESLRLIGVVLFATLLISAGSAITRAVMSPASFSRGSAPVAYIQESFYWYMGGVVLIGIIVGAVKMAWTQRAEAGAELAKSLLTLVVVSGAGLSAVGLFTKMADEFSVWLLDGSMSCSLDADGACFTSEMGALTVGSSDLGRSGRS